MRREEDTLDEILIGSRGDLDAPTAAWLG